MTYTPWVNHFIWLLVNVFYQSGNPATSIIYLLLYHFFKYWEEVMVFSWFTIKYISINLWSSLLSKSLTHDLCHFAHSTIDFVVWKLIVALFIFSVLFFTLSSSLFLDCTSSENLLRIWSWPCLMLPSGGIQLLRSHKMIKIWK